MSATYNGTFKLLRNFLFNCPSNRNPLNGTFFEHMNSETNKTSEENEYAFLKGMIENREKILRDLHPSNTLKQIIKPADFLRALDLMKPHIEITFSIFVNTNTFKT